MWICHEKITLRIYIIGLLCGPKFSPFHGFIRTFKHLHSFQINERIAVKLFLFCTAYTHCSQCSHNIDTDITSIKNSKLKLEYFYTQPSYNMAHMAVVRELGPRKFEFSDIFGGEVQHGLF